MNDKTEECRIAELINCESIEKLTDKLVKFALGELKLSDQQAEAAMLIIDKAIPDLKPVTLAEALGEEGD